MPHSHTSIKMIKMSFVAGRGGDRSLSGLSALVIVSESSIRLGCNEREVNKVKHSVTDSCSLPVNQ